MAINYGAYVGYGLYKPTDVYEAQLRWWLDFVVQPVVGVGKFTILAIRRLTTMAVERVVTLVAERDLGAIRAMERAVKAVVVSPDRKITRRG